MDTSELNIIKPFRALRPCQHFAKQFICPPYDVIDNVEAKKIVSKNPHSFLNIVKPEISFDPTMEGCVYSQAKARLQQIIDLGHMQYEKQECYYIYRIEDGVHTQTGIVALVSASAYTNKKIKPHEATLPDKLLERMQFTNVLKIQTGPTMLFYRNTEKIKRLLNSLTEQTPDLNLKANDGIKHSLWIVNDKKQIKNISKQFNTVNKLYIADGHHRIAAIANLNNISSNDSSYTAYDSFLAAMFPEENLKVISYNRILKGIKNFDPKNIIKIIESIFYVEKIENILKDPESNLLMYLDSVWYDLSLRSTTNNQQNYRDILCEFEFYLSKLTESLGNGCTKEYIPGSSPTDFVNVINNTENAFGFFLAPVSIYDICSELR